MLQKDYSVFITSYIAEMRILILSKEAWRDEQNGGNVLSNIFKDFDAEFAQIYCNECLPNNNICTNYFRITDREMLNSIRGKETAGKRLKFECIPNDTILEKESFSSGKKWLKSLLPILRELVWWMGKWNEKKIIDFVTEFNPDIIFAPCYGNHYMHKLTHLVHSITDAKIISYISDDHYSNHQLRWEPWYWINHLILRCNTRKVFKLYSLVYTMTSEQKIQCEQNFNANMKVLCKAGTFDKEFLKHKVNKPIKIIYAGGIYLNRWKTLKLLVDAIRDIDSTGQSFTLDIYTNNPLSAEMNKAINDRVVSTVHPVVKANELKDIYHKADIALHCESFDIINRLKVRLSFSTKIVDCLDSGCAVMAICDPKQAGLAYLKRNDAAICITQPSSLEIELNNILQHPDILLNYQHKAFELGNKNHQASQISKSITTDFEFFSK